MSKILFISKYLLFAFFLCVATACGSQEKSNFEDARKIDTIDSYYGYLSKYPRGKYNKIALQRIFSLEVPDALERFIKYAEEFEKKKAGGFSRTAPSGLKYMSESTTLISLAKIYNKKGTYSYIYDDKNILAAYDGLSSLAGGMSAWRETVIKIVKKYSAMNLASLTREEQQEFDTVHNQMVELWHKITYPDMKKDFVKIQDGLSSYEKYYKNTDLNDFNAEYALNTPNAEKVSKDDIDKEMIAFRQECDNIGSHLFQLGGRKLENLDLEKSYTILKNNSEHITFWPLKAHNSAKVIVDRIDEIVQMKIHDKSKLIIFSGDIGQLIAMFFKETKELSGK